MEDSLSVKSNESLATSEEFDFIGEKPGISRTPTLDVNGGDFNELQNALREVLQEQEINMSNVIEENRKEIGKSTFYVGPMSSNLSPTEKQDSMKSGASSDEEVLDVDQDCTIFAGVTYLGPALINAPKSEVEIKRHMSNLNEQNGDLGLKVSVSVPCSSTGVVVLYDATTNSVIARYEIHRILFYARGGINTPEAGCFAFTWSHGDSLESAIFQCHIFRCDIGEAVSRVSACFSKAFQRVPRSMSSSITSACDMNSSITTLSELRTLLYVFEVNLEIKEDDGKGSYSTVGKDKQGFKLKVNTEKQLCLSIRQVSDNGPQLLIERCFGLLVAAGKHVRHSDMQLLEMDETTSQNNICVDKNCSFICAAWDPTEPNFELLNCETPKDVKQFLSVAVDLVIQGIREPVRFQIETLVRVLGQNERNFWYFQRKTLVQQFYLNLKEVPSPDSNDVYFEVLSMESSGELDRNLLNLNLISNLIPSPSINSIETTTPKDEYYSDGDEPLLSGTGLVSKDCSKDVLEQWAEVLNRWKSTQQRPKQLTSLVKIGIPEALRGEVWQRLAGVEQANNMMDIYRILITQESSCENVIKRDIARTFPAHDFFKEAGGLGQDSLYRVSKAYAVHDTEVGYCQGLSFLAATLLLHMPEEQAFCVLDKLMYDYGLRDLYKDGFDNLYLRLYQLNKLMEEQQSSLWNHFNEHNIETHMFASQWFLTLFTARFPLFFVFHIIDIFLLQGIDTIFQIALALLMQCKKDLLLLDFEGILKYFRVSLPKKCRTEESAKNLIKLACSIKVKKLKKYETEFNTLKEAADNQNVQSEADQLRLVISRYDEDEKLMAKEISQLKEMLKREATRADNEKLSNMTIINDYNLVRQRMEAQVLSIRTELDNLKCKISECDQCSQYLIVDNKKPEQRASGGQVITDDERVKELELELAQTKLAHVEAECKNQDLTHKLRSAELELNTAKNTWTPWLSKTLTSIKEVANKKDFSHFNYSSINPTATFISHVNSTRRESVPAKKEPHQNIDGKDLRRESVPIMQDSQSCSNLKGTHI